MNRRRLLRPPFEDWLVAFYTTSAPASAYGWHRGRFADYRRAYHLGSVNGGACCFTPDGRFLVFGNGSLLRAVAFDDTGMGRVQYVPAAGPPSTVNGLAAVAGALAVAHATTPFVTAYPFAEGDFGTAFSQPATLPESTGVGCAFSPAGDYLAVVNLGAGRRLTVYPWSGAGFGAKLADPATVPAGNGRCVCWSPAGDYIAVGHDTTPFLSVYPFANGVIGDKLANPDTLPASPCFGVGFSPDGGHLAVAYTSSSPYLSVYPFAAGTFGTPYQLDATTASNNVRNAFSVSWSSDGGYLAVQCQFAPYSCVVPFAAGSGLGTPLLFPAVPLTFPSGGRTAWRPRGTVGKHGYANPGRGV